jgi:hypothetical protein
MSFLFVSNYEKIAKFNNKDTFSTQYIPSYGPVLGRQSLGVDQGLKGFCCKIDQIYGTTTFTFPDYNFFGGITQFEIATYEIWQIFR